MLTRKEREYLYLLVFQSEFHEDKNEGIDDFSISALEEEKYFDELDLKRLSVENVDNITDAYKDICQNINNIDNIINTCLKGWTTKRIGKVELALLRVTTYELERCHNEEEKSSMINNIINMAHKYGDNKSYSFINAVISNIDKREKDDI